MKNIKELQIIFNKLQENGYDVYLVGGAIRNTIWNLQVNDYDICTSASAINIVEIFKDYKVFQINKISSTITVVINSIYFEITSYKGNTLEEDLLNRDFTINAIAYNNKYIGLTNTLTDIQNRVVRLVDGKRTLKDDPLRILRAIRLSAQYDLTIEHNSEEIILNNIELLDTVSTERIRDEFFKLLLSSNPSYYIRKYFKIIEYIIPELSKLKGFNQHNDYHIYDVLEHTLVALDNSNDKIEVRLALLFHDIGKPNTYKFENNKGTFYNHNFESVTITKGILNRLRTSNEIKYNVLQLIEYHDYRLSTKRKHLVKFLSKYNGNISDLLEVKRCDILAQNPKYFHNINELNDIAILIDEILSSNQCLKLKDLEINGRDLVELNYKDVEIGIKLKEVLELVISEELNNNRNELLEYVSINRQK